MKAKAEPKVYTRVGWDWKGETVVKWIWINKERYPYTQAQWERRQARLAAKEEEQ
jgi:hypothetical protein